MAAETLNVSIPVAYIATDGRFTHVNQRWRDHTGLSVESGIHDFAVLLPAEDRKAFEVAIDNALRNGEATCIRTQIRRLSQSVRSTTIVITRDEASDLPSIGLMLLDHGVQKEAETEQLFEHQFLARMSHDMRNRMSAVLGFSQILRKDPAMKHQIGTLDLIDEAGRGVLATLTDALHLSKLETSDDYLSQLPFEIEPLLKNLNDALINKKLPASLFHLGEIPRHPSAVVGDPLRVEQVILSLTGHLLRDKQQGEIRLLTEVWHESDRQFVLRFTLRDNDPALNKPGWQKLRAAIEARTIPRGSIGEEGFSLILAQRLVKKMTGNITVLDQDPQTLTVHIDIPFGKVSDGSPAEDKIPPGGYPQGQGRIVLAEDDPVNRTLTERILKTAGYDVILASNGLEAVEKVTQSHPAPDLVVMDIDMPVMNGLTAAALIRRNPSSSKIPIIALTGGILTTEFQAALEAGINEFITKPFDLDPFLNTIQERLGHTGENRRNLAEVLRNIARSGDDHRPIERDGLLLGHAISACARDLAFYRELLQAFAEEFKDAPVRFEALFDTHQWDPLLREIRHLKGAASSLGALRLAHLSDNLFKTLTHQASHEPNEAIRSDLVSLNHEVKSLLGIIGRALNGLH